MFVTKKFFEKWVEENIGARKKNMFNYILYGFSSKNVNERIDALQESNNELSSRLVILSKQLGYEYKTIEEKTGYVKVKKSNKK